MQVINEDRSRSQDIFKKLTVEKNYTPNRRSDEIDKDVSQLRGNLRPDEQYLDNDSEITYKKLDAYYPSTNNEQLYNRSQSGLYSNKNAISQNLKSVDHHQVSKTSTNVNLENTQFTQPLSMPSIQRQASVSSSLQRAVRTKKLSSRGEQMSPYSKKNDVTEEVYAALSSIKQGVQEFQGGMIMNREGDLESQFGAQNDNYKNQSYTRIQQDHYFRSHNSPINTRHHKNDFVEINL